MRSDIAHVHNLSTVPVEDSDRNPWFEDDSEWEYEYDDVHTEDFFFTVDLTTHLPDALNKRMTARNGRFARGTMEARTKRPRNKKDRGKVGDDPAAIFVENGAGIDLQALKATDDMEEDDFEDTSEPAGKIQFVGLDTATPYIMFNDNFYSAYWMTNIGTQLWVSRPGVSESTIFNGHVLDVIGASQVRLLAKPAKIRPRFDYTGQSAPKSNPGLQTSVSSNFITEDADDEDRTVGPLSIPKTTILDSTLQDHANFMERFSALKWSRGETDQMPVYSVRQYEFPGNAAEIRARALEVEAQDPANKRQRIDDGSIPRQLSMDSGPILSSANLRKERRHRRIATVMVSSDDDEGDNEDNVEQGNDLDDGGDENAEEGAESDDAEPTTSIAKTSERVRARQAKLISMGLLDTAAAATPPVKRKRRTKAQMEADRAAERARMSLA